MKRKFPVIGVALLAVAASVLLFIRPAAAAVGLHVSGRNIVEANGSTFIMRGVSHEHTWFSNQTSSFANIKSLRDNAQTVLDADTQHNTVLSIHMYDVFNTASSITSYLDAFASKGWPLVIGEFGWHAQSTNVDDTTVMSEAVSRGIGYLGWSWQGNNDP